MKRKGNLFEKIIHKQNIHKAILNARKGKTKRPSIKKVDENLTEEINKIHNALKNKTYVIAKYETETRMERGKLRKLYKLPYNPDRIIQHAIIQVIEPVLSKTFITDTYQSIKGRGCHKAKKKIIRMLKSNKETKYILKIDVEKYYPNINNKILKNMLRKKIKCKPTLELLDLLIDSVKGLAIGNYISQILGNFYLSYFDHFVKEKLKVKNYVRYADDMVFMLDSKAKLAEIKRTIDYYFKHKLKIKIKRNWQIFPFISRGLDFLGFRFFKNFTILRKSIKKSYLKTVKKIIKKKPILSMINSLMSYYGWIKATNSYNLLTSTFTSVLKEKIDIIVKTFGISNPILKINTHRKRKNRLRYYQPTLF